MSNFPLAEHVDHGAWKTVGRCVYCRCGERLYQGKAPKDHEDRSKVAEALDDVIGAAITKLLDGQPGA